eukprot:maker-scaffold_7-snap-gene-12.36-mRNA-1 protein AED:0.02 eAED:0.02 QI:146/1/1/1/1/1/6/95/433
MSFFSSFSLYRKQIVQCLSISCSSAIVFSVSGHDFSICEAKPSRREVFSWGSGVEGQLGISSKKDEFQPKKVSSFLASGFAPQKISSYGNKTLVLAKNLTQNSSLFSFGSPVTDEISFTVTVGPTQLNTYEISDALVDCSVGDSHVAVVTSSGKLYTVGDGFYGQLGLDFSNEKQRPLRGERVHKKHFRPEFSNVEFDQPAKIVQVSCGHVHTLCLSTDGKVFGFGKNHKKALGVSSDNKVFKPQRIEKGIEGVKVKQVAAGRDFSLFLAGDGKVYSCGANEFGQLGLSTSELSVSEPRLISSLSGENIVQVAAGEYHAAAITEAGKVYTFGLGKDGQTGQPGKNNLTAPKQVAGLSHEKVVQVSCGNGHTAVVTESGNLYAWGRGRNGQLGRGDHLESIAAERVEPQLVDTIKGKPVYVSCGADHTVAIVES